MKINNAKIAGGIAAFYVTFFVSGIFIHYFLTGEIYTLKYSLMLPSVWITAIMGLIISWGLWNHYRWAWWLGLGAGTYQLLASILYVIEQALSGITIKFGVIAVLVLLICFLTFLLLPATRKQCIR